MAEIIKSSNDKREYKAFKLDNEMTVLIISDPGWFSCFLD